MQIWRRLCDIFRSEMKIVDCCFTLMTSKPGGEDSNAYSNMSSETIQLRKSQAQQLKTFLSKNVENQKDQDPNLTSRILFPDFSKLLLRVLYFPFDLFGCKMDKQNRETIGTQETSLNLQFHTSNMNNLLANDSDVLHIMKEILVLYGGITNTNNLPPFHYISKHQKTSLTHAYLKHLVEDLTEKIELQYVCMISNIDDGDANSMITSNMLMRDWILYGTKFLSLLCTLCHESQRFKVAILSTPSGKDTVHGLQKLIKHFTWMIFDYRRQQLYSPQSETLFDFVNQLMAELKSILNLSRSVQHAINFAQEYAEEILFETEFSNLFEMQSSLSSIRKEKKISGQPVTYSTDEILQFASLCEGIWESVLNQLSKWSLQDGSTYDQAIFQQLENVLILALDTRRNSKIRKTTLQFWCNTFAQSSIQLTYSQKLKQTFALLLQKNEISRLQLPNFPVLEECNPLSTEHSSNSSTSSSSATFVANAISEEGVNKRKRNETPIETVASEPTNTKKTKLTKSQKEKLRERKETRLVVPDMNPSLLSSSLLSLGDSDDEDISPIQPIKKEEILNISDIVAAPKSELNDSSLIDIQHGISTPIKKQEAIVNLITPDSRGDNIKIPTPHFQSNTEEEESNRSSVEDLFNQMETGCTPIIKTKDENSSPSISFTAPTAPSSEIKVLTNTPPKKIDQMDDDDETQIPLQRSPQMAPITVTPILKKGSSPLEPETTLKYSPDMPNSRSKKHVRFEREQSSPADLLSQFENAVKTTRDKLSSEERRRLLQRLHSIMGSLLSDD